jgi:hypothetical protein
VYSDDLVATLARLPALRFVSLRHSNFVDNEGKFCCELSNVQRLVQAISRVRPDLKVEV